MSYVTTEGSDLRTKVAKGNPFRYEDFVTFIQNLHRVTAHGASLLVPRWISGRPHSLELSSLFAKGMTMRSL